MTINYYIGKRTKKTKKRLSSVGLKKFLMVGLVGGLSIATTALLTSMLGYNSNLPPDNNLRGTKLSTTIAAPKTMAGLRQEREEITKGKG